jgi:hypothetical protein
MVAAPFDRLGKIERRDPMFSAPYIRMRLGGAEIGKL